MAPKRNQRSRKTNQKERPAEYYVAKREQLAKAEPNRKELCHASKMSLKDVENNGLSKQPIIRYRGFPLAAKQILPTYWRRSSYLHGFMLRSRFQSLSRMVP